MQNMTMNYQFDARQYDPNQGTPAHPVGKFLATITDTAIKPTKDNDGGYFEVEFTTQHGKASMRYNLWNKNQQAVDIAHRQLSALCHSVGIYNVDMNNGGLALRNAQLTIEVAKQKDSEYTEVKRVYDVNGNEPGKAGNGPAPAAQPAQAGNGWGQQPAQQQPAPQAAPQQQPAQGWGQQAPAQAPAQAQQPQQPQGGAPWGGQQQLTQQAPAAQQPAPWGQQAAPQGQAPWGQR